MSELVYLAFGAEPVDYLKAWELQRRLHAWRVADEVPDSCLLLEHQPVYTAGKRTAASDRPFGDPGAPVIDVDRGGKITWHGPGQLTGYPIVKLGDPIDVVAYVRALEESMIRTCAEFGVTAVRVPGRSGAWVEGEPDRKVGAIGARVARGVTMHGIALNCDCDLSWFDRIVPCGISDAGVTTLSAEAGRHVTVAEVTPVLERHLAGALGYQTWRRSPHPESLVDPADQPTAADPADQPAAVDPADQPAAVDQPAIQATALGTGAASVVGLASAVSTALADLAELDTGQTPPAPVDD